MREDDFLRNKFKNLYEKIPPEILVEKSNIQIMRKVTEAGSYMPKGPSVRTQLQYLFIKPQTEGVPLFSFFSIEYRGEEKRFILDIENLKKFVTECKEHNLDEEDLKFILDDLLETTKNIMLYYEFKIDEIENLQKNIKNFFEMYSSIKLD